MYQDAAYVSVLDELWVIDVGNINSLQLANTLLASTLGAAAEVEISVVGDLLITSDVDDHRLWSLADPLNPVFVANLPLGMSASRILDAASLGGYSYFWYEGELLGFDLSNPSTPSQVSTLSPGWSHDPGILASTDTHLIACFDDQIQLLEVFDATAVAPIPRQTTGILHANTPNPFSGRTVIHWESGLTGPIQIKIHDVAGRLVQEWKLQDASVARLLWDGRTRTGSRVASGVYYVSAVSGSQRDARRVVVRR
jgi:hypothetical protein